MCGLHWGGTPATSVFGEKIRFQPRGGLNPLKHKQISAVDKNRLEKFEQN